METREIIVMGSQNECRKFSRTEEAIEHITIHPHENFTVFCNSVLTLDDIQKSVQARIQTIIKTVDLRTVQQAVRQKLEAVLQ